MDMNMAMGVLAKEALKKDKQTTTKGTDEEGVVRDRKGQIDADKTMANMTRMEFEDFKKNWAPVEEKLIEKSQTDTSLIDSAKADALAGPEQQLARLNRNAMRYGANYTEAQKQNQRNVLGRTDAIVDVDSISNARLAQKDQNRALMNDLINIGSGVQREGLSALSNAAQNESARKQAYEQAKANRTAMIYQTLGGIGAAAIIAAI